MTDDHQLLAQFSRENSESAFAALVERHVGLVYSVALRSTGNAHAAEEIAQAVFIILAKKADALSAKIILSGWLYQTTRLTAANYRRGEIRRQQREQEAYMESNRERGGDASAFADETVWRQIAPLLDDALDKLGAKDRNAIALRFFENQSLAEVGAALGASEDAAKMRVNRALEKLRKIFTKRGVTLSATLIAGAASANSVSAAPVGLAKTISVVAFTKGAAVGGSTLALVKGALKLMAWTKAKMAILVGVGVLLAVGTTISVEKIIAPSAPFIQITGKCQIELYTTPPRVVETGNLVILTDGKSYRISIDSKGDGSLTNDVYDVKAGYGSDGNDVFVLSDQLSVLHRTHEGLTGFADAGRFPIGKFSDAILAVKAAWIAYCSEDYFNTASNQTGLQLGEGFSMVWPGFITNQVTYWPASTMPQSITGWSRNWIIANRNNSLQPLQAIELPQYPNGFKAWKFTASDPVMVGNIRVPRQFTLETFFPKPPNTATTGDETLLLRKTTFIADSIKAGTGKFNPLPAVTVPDLQVLDSRFEDIAASFVIASHATPKGWPTRGSDGFKQAAVEAKKLASENRAFVQSELKKERTGHHSALIDLPVRMPVVERGK